MSQIHSEPTEFELRCLVYDDSSTDGGYDVACRTVAGDARFELIRNESKMWMVGNVWQCSRRKDVADDDIIVQVDGDDWLPDAAVLERLSSAYADGYTWVTYGNYMWVG